MSDGELKEKFQTCALPVLSEEKTAALCELLRRLEQVKEISEVMRNTY